MDVSPTDETAQQVARHLRDGCASVKADQERAIAGLEACLDLLPGLCERIQARRHTLSRLVTEARAQGQALAMPTHPGAREPLARKLLAARAALDGLLR